MSFSETLKKYLTSRQCFKDEDFKGKMTSDPSLRSLQQAIDSFYWPLKELCRKNASSWKIQIGFGKGNATADQYVAVIPLDQKVSEGIFFCICFDHSGTGCVMGAMAAMKKTPLIGLPLIERALCPSKNDSGQKWQMVAPYTIDIGKWNNAFFYCEEIHLHRIISDELSTEKQIINCFEKSRVLIEKILSERQEQ